MKVLVIGSGGREHAIAWNMARCASVRKVYVAPGNPGCATVAECIPVLAAMPENYLAVAKAVGADLTVVGPEAPLVDGVVDAFEAVQLPIFGPTKAAAQLEGSKIFTKRFLERHSIPTARYLAAERLTDAIGALAGFSYPIVLKADGLAAGKGVVTVEDRAQAESVLCDMFSGSLVGAAGSRVVVEEFLRGEEVSFIALSDGKEILALEPSQDHKAIWDGDKGPNTGGMGAYSDNRILSEAQRAFVMDHIMRPTIDGMAADGAPFRGFLYAGLMMTSDGPKVLEFNVRLGDPETQALLHRMDGDFAAVLAAASRRELQGETLSFRTEPSLCVVIAAEGYPGRVRTGDVIHGIEAAESSGATVFQAGTKQAGSEIQTSGGRVLGVTASGKTLQDAMDAAYTAVGKIRFDGMQFRRDIGRKGLTRYN